MLFGLLKEDLNMEMKIQMLYQLVLYDFGSEFDSHLCHCRSESEFSNVTEF